MIITIDTETYGLDTTRPVMACICFETGKCEHFNNVQKCWERIHEIALQCSKHEKCLYIYAHNMLYDYYVLRQQKRPTNHFIYSHRPTIIDVKDLNHPKKRIYAKFLSTTSLWRGSLESLGNAMGCEKGITPSFLLEGREGNFMEMREAHAYMERDARIVMTYIKSLRKLLKDNNMSVRRLISASQIGMKNLITIMKKAPNYRAFFEDLHDHKLWSTTESSAKMIDEAARGGRNEVFNLGKHNNVSEIDINSHYTNEMINLEMPNLSTERFLINPLANNKISLLFGTIGISNCAIRLKKDIDYGVLPIRIDTKESLYPNKKGQILIGTWTHQELKYALNRGYEVLHVDWSLVWQRTENPFTEELKKIYLDKQNAKNEVEKYFHKTRLNGGIGKFKQNIVNKDYIWASIDEDSAMRKSGYEPEEVCGRDRLYSKILDTHFPKFYSPILYALITANARLKLLEFMEKIPIKDIFYVDTDSIIAKDKAIKNVRFKYGKDLGEFKEVIINTDALFYSKKSARIGDSVKLSGISKNWYTIQDFNNGIIQYKRMLTEKTTSDINKIGTFKRLETNLNSSITKHLQKIDKLNKLKLIIDDRSSIKSYMNLIPKWMQQEGYMH